MMKARLRTLVLGIVLLTISPLSAQQSVAHKWIEVNLNSIRSDFARPPQAARNLWHTSLAMYDAWAAYDSIADPFFLGNSMGDYECAFDGVPEPADMVAAQELAMSYAAFQIIKARYHYNPALDTTIYALEQIMTELGLDPNYAEADYTNGDPRDLGNYIAFELLTAASMDGSNEGSGDFFGYQNLVYEPVNDSLPIQFPEYLGNPTIDSLNRYQPLSFLLFCDQIVGTFNDYVPPFIGAEWGHVVPFSLTEDDKTIRTREGIDWPVYHDPGAPPRIDDLSSEESQLHLWNMQLVLNWSKHLTADDATIWDVSPASIGNLALEDLPTDLYDHELFYNFENGGDGSTGHALNPSTGLPYEPQLVKRADYARILAEFWADGPNSETPPGHWFRIYNEIKDSPDFTWKWEGEGEELSRLEYDIKTYFSLGGTMHDAAIASWSIKGYYDYVRPVSAIRAMAEIGQISDDGLPNYDPTGKGLPLVPGWIELIEAGDPLEGDEGEFVDELKVMCWLGPLDEDTCIAGLAPVYDTLTAGVGWKLALDWWPYQRPTFVTPAFAGYVSGHSTFSRAAAECMTRITGDRYFPGGMGEFYCPQDEFLVFEVGPSTDVTLQWATYQDASDQCSLSRIWGGIHPPADDIPGRLIGYEVGNEAFDFANTFILGGVPELTEMTLSDNVITDADIAAPWTLDMEFSLPMDTLSIPTILFTPDLTGNLTLTNTDWTSDSTVTMTYAIIDLDTRLDGISIKAIGTLSRYGLPQAEYDHNEYILWDTENPSISSLALNTTVVDESLIGTGTFSVNAVFSETMDETQIPSIGFPVEDASTSLVSNSGLSGWNSAMSYSFSLDVLDNLVILEDVDLSVSAYADSLGNIGVTTNYQDMFDISIMTGVVEYASDGHLVVYPNPLFSGEDMRIRSDIALADVHIKIFDALGKNVLEQRVGDIDHESLQIPTRELQAGSYLVQLQGREDIISVQILIMGR